VGHADAFDMRFPLVAALACALASCGADADTLAAASVFDTFQHAVQRGDAAACRPLLTEESAQALLAMPWGEIQKRQPLHVLGAERFQEGFRVQVQDPNEGGRASEFVVVRENGRLVVDLVATAGLHAEPREAVGSRETTVPRELTPADRDRIRQFELAQQPR
jgi:hypothetical protein